MSYHDKDFDWGRWRKKPSTPILTPEQKLKKFKAILQTPETQAMESPALVALLLEILGDG